MRKVWIALFNFNGQFGTEVWTKPYGSHYPGMIALLGPVEVDANIGGTDTPVEQDGEMAKG